MVRVRLRPAAALADVPAAEPAAVAELSDELLANTKSMTLEEHTRERST